MYSTFHVELVLEWFRTKPTAERTPERLASIAAHVGMTYALTPEGITSLTAAVAQQAQEQGVVQGDHGPRCDSTHEGLACAAPATVTYVGGLRLCQAHADMLDAMGLHRVQALVDLHIDQVATHEATEDQQDRK